MIRGDSTEYELLKKWCTTLPFYDEPKSGYVPADPKYRFDWEAESNLPTYLLPYDPDLNDTH